MAHRKLSGVLLHRQASPASLGLLRIWVFGIWLALLLRDPLHLLARLPVEAFSAPGILSLVPDGLWPLLLSEAGLTAFRMSTLGGVLLVLLGVLPHRLLLIGVTCLLVYYQGVVRGFSGHMNHAELVLLYTTGIVAIFPCFDAFSIRQPNIAAQPRSQYATPFLAIAFLLCLTYSFTGIVRLAKGPDLFFSDTLRNLILNNWIETGYMTGEGFAAPSEPSTVLEILPQPMLKVSYLIATFLELLAPLVLLSRPFRLVWVCFAVAFHVANAQWLGVPFFENMLLFVVFSEKWFHEMAVGFDGSIRRLLCKWWHGNKSVFVDLQ